MSCYTFNKHKEAPEWHERKVNSQRWCQAFVVSPPVTAAGQLTGALAATPIPLWAEVKVQLKTWGKLGEGSWSITPSL